MPKYVAFLRAINVGGHIVKMDRLRQLFEAMGHSKVTTFIASGNVIFDSTSRTPSALEKKIATHLHNSLGYEVGTFIRTIAELTAIVNYNPFDEAELTAAGNVFYVGFLGATPDPDVQRRVRSLSGAVDEFHVYGRELYWLCRKKISDSEVSGPLLGKALGTTMTVRNINTVRRITLKFYARDGPS